MSTKSYYANKFGWDLIAGDLIPFIHPYKKNELISTVMVYAKIFKKYKRALSNEIHTCLGFETYFMTKSDAELFNHIYKKHCDGFLGEMRFARFDSMMALNDGKELYLFIKRCMDILTKNHTYCDEGSKFGFVRINNIQYPFVNINGTQYVPLVCFPFLPEDHWMQKNAIKIQNWDLSYIKFAFKLQGIKTVMLGIKALPAVRLCEVRIMFPPEKLLYDWPKYDYKEFLNPPY